MRTASISVSNHGRAAVEIFARAAPVALYEELCLSPKPGLVTPYSVGSHRDMDAHTFMRSIFSLRRYFLDISQAGFEGADFPVLETLGIEAEKRMLGATGGVNTHRGAIFQLGLLCAAAGATARKPAFSLTPQMIQDSLVSNWGVALSLRSARVSQLPGGIAARRFSLRSASEEAALGFPVLFEIALPALQLAFRKGLSASQARLETLLHVIEILDDSNLAHRGGEAGLRLAQMEAGKILAEGGIQSPRGLVAVEELCKLFEDRNLSPGGAADTLASACWLHKVCTIS